MAKILSIISMYCVECIFPGKEGCILVDIKKDDWEEYMWKKQDYYLF